MKDFLGNEYGVGDMVVYPSMMYGSAMQMVEAEVLEILGGRVKVRPGRTSRSSDRYNSKYRDNRNGKWLTKLDKHVKKESHYRNQKTGEEIDRATHYRTVKWSNPDYYDWKYVPVEYNDYIELVEGLPGTPVVLTVTKNVVKVNR